MIKSKLISPNCHKCCVTPTMPAIPPSISTKLSDNVKIEAPLKCSHSPYSTKQSKGYQSGLRSSIIPCKIVNSNETTEDWVIAIDSMNGDKFIPDDNGNVYIRAKGCGMWLPNNDLPFPAITLQEMFSVHAQEGQDLYEIRGVCFPNTSCTEIYVNDQIEANLNKIGLMSANHSIGFWLYKNLQDDSSPSIQKSVTLFKTLGDRRLEAHLFTGLEKLIPKKFDEKLCDKVIELILPLYDNNTDLIPQTNNPSYKKVSKLRTKMVSNFINSHLNNFENVTIDDFNDDELKKIGIVPSYQIYDVLKNLESNLDLMLRLYGRLGFECGRSLSVVHRTGYLWGTYVDHNPSEQHCNAHNDNLVVLPKEESLKNTKKLQFLAPLDFDMSFKKENAVNFWCDPAQPDPTYVTSQIFGELMALLQDVGGFFANVAVSSNIHTREVPPKSLGNLLWLLRDIACYEFLQGYQNVDSDRCKGNDISRDEGYLLIQEALDETINEES